MHRQILVSLRQLNISYFILLFLLFSPPEAGETTKLWKYLIGASI